MIILDLELKQTHPDKNSGVVDECQLVYTTRWMQAEVMPIIGVAYAMTYVIKGKHVLIDKVFMKIQLYAKYILFIYHVMIYYYIFLYILNFSNVTSIIGTIYRISCTRGGRSSTYVERPYLDDDQGEHKYEKESKTMSIVFLKNK